jgi:hypothetical protein
MSWNDRGYCWGRQQRVEWCWLYSLRSLKTGNKGSLILQGLGRRYRKWQKSGCLCDSFPKSILALALALALAHAPPCSWNSMKYPVSQSLIFRNSSRLTTPSLEDGVCFWSEGFLTGAVLAVKHRRPKWLRFPSTSRFTLPYNLFYEILSSIKLLLLIELLLSILLKVWELKMPRNWIRIFDSGTGIGRIGLRVDVRLTEAWGWWTNIRWRDCHPL